MDQMPEDTIISGAVEREKAQQKREDDAETKRIEKEKETRQKPEDNEETKRVEQEKKKP